MGLHTCKTSDGTDIPCHCVHGVDHDEASFDQPRAVPAQPAESGSKKWPPELNEK